MDDIIAPEFAKTITEKNHWNLSDIFINYLFTREQDMVSLGYILSNYEEKFLIIPVDIVDPMTDNRRKWKVHLDFSIESPIFKLIYNKREITQSEKFSEIIDAVVKMNEELREKYLTSKKNAAQNKGDIRYIIATAIREEGIKRNIRFESAVTGDDAYAISFSRYVDTLHYGRQELNIRVKFDTESNVEIWFGKLRYKIFMADPSFDPDKLVALVYHLIDDIAETEKKSHDIQTQHFNHVVQTWFKKV